MFSQKDVTNMFVSVGPVCLCNNWDNCAVMMMLDYVGLFANTRRLKPQHLQTRTLIMQQNPIGRSTDIVFMTKRSQIQAWLNGLYAEHRASKHVHAVRRPGAPAPAMIHRSPTLAHKQYGAVGMSLVNQNQT